MSPGGETPLFHFVYPYGLKKGVGVRFLSYKSCCLFSLSFMSILPIVCKIQSVLSIPQWSRDY